MLNDRQIPKLPKGRHSDARGLYLVVSASAARKWVYRYRMDGKSHDLGLGSYPQISLKQARQQRDRHESERLQGQNPIALKRARREAAQEARQRTFAAALEAAYTVKAETITNAKYRKQWHALVARYALPKLGELPIAEITVHDIHQVLRPIWNTKPESARKLVQNLGFIFNWSIAKEWRQADNPALITGPLGILLPHQKPKIRPHPALPYPQLPRFMARLGQQSSTAAYALQFMILTAARTSEVLGLQRSEIDTTVKLWSVPAERMKIRKPHRVPLSHPAMAILAHQTARHNHHYVFPGGRPERPLSNMAMLKLIRTQFPKTDATPHGFRSTFRDWAGEQTRFDAQAIEFCLAHTLPNPTQAAYLRTDFLAERRRIMDEWAHFAVPEAPRDNLNGRLQ